MKKVYVQADAKFRMLPEDVDKLYVRSANGEMVPFSAFTTSHWVYGSPRLERYNGLVERYEIAKAKIEKLQATKAQRESKAEDIGGFMFELAERGDPITEFDDRLWLTVIDTVTVHRDGRLTFKFQIGHELTV